MRFRHFLLTRFNLREVAGPQAGPLPPAVIGDDWLARRIPLFRDFCLPSVLAQTVKPDQWLIFMDTHTPQRFRDELAALVQGQPWIRLLYVDGMPACMPALRDHIAQHAVDCSHVITSRIDNDDCLHRGFIAAVQQEFRGQQRQAIDFVHGYSLQLAPLVRIGRCDQLSNPFISLIERNDAPQTVWAHQHAHWKKTRSPERYHRAGHGQRLWMAVIHAQNKVNLFSGHGDVDWARVRQDFAIAPAQAERIASQLQPRASWRWRSLRNRLKARAAEAATAVKRGLGRYPK